MKNWSSFIQIFILLSATSCTQFLPHRDYLTEMETDDSGFYEPNQDFPVVAGDTGQMYETPAERRRRTPASAQEVYAYKHRRTLEDELRELENKQSETSMEQYQKYRQKLKTTSERIYFLKLPSRDRMEYLSSRGFLDPIPTSASPEMFTLRNSNLNIGMTKHDVVENWGRPLRVEVAGNPSYENERWLYNSNGASKYIYFESGRVEGWE